MICTEKEGVVSSSNILRSCPLKLHVFYTHSCPETKKMVLNSNMGNLNKTTENFLWGSIVEMGYLLTRVSQNTAVYERNWLVLTHCLLFPCSLGLFNPTSALFRNEKCQADQIQGHIFHESWTKGPDTEGRAGSRPAHADGRPVSGLVATSVPPALSQKRRRGSLSLPGNKPSHLEAQHSAFLKVQSYIFLASQYNLVIMNLSSEVS